MKLVREHHLTCSALMFVLALSIPHVEAQVITTEVLHAPTAQQCKSDGTLWQASSTSIPAVGELWNRIRELETCRTVDPDSRIVYESAEALMYGEIYSRGYNFLERHKLREEFFAEDASGKRCQYNVSEVEGSNMSLEIDGRGRCNNGRIIRKHGNTLVSELRAIYGPEFLAGWRADAHLQTVREETGMSLSQLVRTNPSRR